MRPLLAAACGLLLAGCASAPPQPDGPSAPPPPPAGPPTRTENLAGRELLIGGPETTPPTNASARLEVMVPNGTTAIVLNVTIHDGGSTGFRIRGFPGCAWGPENVAAPQRITKDCGRDPAGSYNLTFDHTSGRVAFRVDLWATVEVA